MKLNSNDDKIVVALTQETYDAIKREITGARDTSLDWIKHFERGAQLRDEGAAYLELKEDVKRLNRCLEELG